MKERREIVRLLKQLNNKLVSLGVNDEKLDTVVEKVVDTLYEELTPKERVLLYKIVIKEFSYRAMVERPDYLIRQNNVTLRTILFSGLIFGSLVFISALLFSNGPLIESIKMIIYHVLNITNTK